METSATRFLSVEDLFVEIVRDIKVSLLAPAERLQGTPEFTRVYLRSGRDYSCHQKEEEEIFAVVFGLRNWK